jgi:hypothetical protein
VTGFDPVIPPGGAGKVNVSIKTNRYRGTITKSVAVYSNDPKNKRASLRLKGTILVPIEVRPSDRVNISGKVGEIKPKELLLVSRDGEPFDILTMRKLSNRLEVALEPAPGSAEKRADGSKAPSRKPAKDAVAGGHAAYKATLSIAEDAPMGRLLDTVVLTTNHPKEPRLQIAVNGRVDGDLVVRPLALYFPVRGRGQPALQQELRLTRRPAGGLEVLGMESTHPDFVPSLHEVAEGLEYRIEVKRPEAKAGSRAEATLKIRTNVGLVEVPISAR